MTSERGDVAALDESVGNLGSQVFRSSPPLIKLSNSSESGMSASGLPNFAALAAAGDSPRVPMIGNRLELIVPMYQYPLSAPGTLNTWWQQALDGATADTPLTVIANPANGPIDASHTNYGDWLFALTALRQNPNIRILGYVKTSVAPDSAVVRQANDILSDVSLYGFDYKHPDTGASLIDGIFLDEMSNDLAYVDTYKTVATGIRANGLLAGQFIAANPGTSVPVEYVQQDTADLFIIREGPPSSLFTNVLPDYVTDPSYQSKGFGAVIHSATQAMDLAPVLREVKFQQLDYVFVTDDSGDNPYDQPPSYFAELFGEIHSPFILSAIHVIPEMAAAGTLVGEVVAGDPDPGQTLSFRIVSGNEAGAFGINAASGEITVVNPAAVDISVNRMFSLLIAVADNGQPVREDFGNVAIAVIERPEVIGVQLNDGSASRSQLTSLAVEFDSVVNSALLADAFELTNVDTGVMVNQLAVRSEEIAGRTRVELTFAGASTIERMGENSQGNSLADGNYRLRVIAARISNLDGSATMLQDFVFGGQQAADVVNDGFFRLLGDTNGDGLLNDEDIAAIVPTLFNPAGYRSDLDTNGDGVINGVDLNGLIPTIHGEGRR
ncbi:MAG: cadherin domain-containing protein [Planctomycetales bacterium]|nr:cadherin domain-containing protein [Planctomycetales bacterium]